MLSRSWPSETSPRPPPGASASGATAGGFGVGALRRGRVVFFVCATTCPPGRTSRRYCSAFVQRFGVLGGRGSAGEGGIVKAYILVQTEVGASTAAAHTIAGIRGVRAVEQVTGPYDVVVEAEARTMDDLASAV